MKTKAILNIMTGTIILTACIVMLLLSSCTPAQEEMPSYSDFVTTSYPFLDNKVILDLNMDEIPDALATRGSTHFIIEKYNPDSETLLEGYPFRKGAEELSIEEISILRRAMKAQIGWQYHQAYSAYVSGTEQETE